MIQEGFFPLILIFPEPSACGSGPPLPMQSRPFCLVFSRSLASLIFPFLSAFLAFVVLGFFRSLRLAGPRPFNCLVQVPKLRSPPLSCLIAVDVPGRHLPTVPAWLLPAYSGFLKIAVLVFENRFSPPPSPLFTTLSLSRRKHSRSRRLRNSPIPHSAHVVRGSLILRRELCPPTPPAQPYTSVRRSDTETFPFSL